MPLSRTLTGTTAEGLEPFELLRRLELLRSLDDATLEAVIEGIEPVRLQEGQVLVRQGESDDALYAVASGTLRTVTVPPSRDERDFKRYGPGGVLGEIQLVLGGAWTATIEAESPCLLYRLSRAVLDGLSDREGEILEPLVWVIRSRMGRAQLADVLPGFLGSLGPQKLDELEKQVQWVTVRRGEALFRQGDPADGWYIVMSGRLQVLRRDELGDLKTLGQIGRGEGVGELSLISGQPRVATPYALRDTELIHFSPESFHALIERYPQALKTLMRTLIEKSIVAPHASAQRRASTRYFTLVPTGPSAPAAAFARVLKQQLSRFGPTLYLNAQELSTFGVLHDVARLPEGHPRWLRFTAWMEEEGPRYAYVVIETDATLTPWTRRAVRLADHVVLVADATATPDPGPIEVGLLAAHDHDRVRARRSLVLVHPEVTRLPSGTQAWLSRRQIDSYHHVRLGDPVDLARLAGILSGRAVGLTLGGGGARGYAHIGVVAALRELGIPIDMVGGTSMGAVIAAQVALGLSREDMIELNLRFMSRKPFAQYTVPMVAMLNAKRLQDGMQMALGDTRIEDLWINTFAVSVNLTTTEMVVLDRGPAWEAVRASVSLPGILPPFVRGLHLLVDGGVINNLPGDVMRQRGAGSVIAVNVSAADDLRFPPSGIPSEWRIFWNKLLPFTRPIPVPGLAAIVMRTLLLASANRTALVERDADLVLKPPLDAYGLLEFKKIHAIVEVGYRYTLEAASRWSGPRGWV
ncbi:MAG: cyclic nucleotide-binding domain-containing protein [Chromatiales bacterium]